MVALAVNFPRRSRNLGNKHRYPVAASANIYAGSVVMINSAGYAVPAVAAASNNGCVGVACARANNSSGAAGDVYVSVQEGEYLMTLVTGIQGNVQDPMYCSDDNTCSGTQAANEPQVGILIELVSATSGWVKMGPELGRL